MQVDLQSALAMVRYAGWLNQDAYNSGKEMLCDKTLQIDFSNFDPQGQIAVGLLQLVQSAQKCNLPSLILLALKYLGV